MPIFTADVEVVSTAGLTDAELRATPVPVSGTVTVTPTGTQDVNIVSTISIPVTGPLTDTQLRATAVPISGSVTVSGTATVNGTVTSNQGTPVAVASGWPVKITDGTNVLGTSSNPLQTLNAVASTSTVTNVTTTGSNITLLAANPNRKKAILYVETSTQYIKLGATASTTSYTYKVTTNGTTIEITNWAGIIDSTGTSGKTILVTELS